MDVEVPESKNPRLNAWIAITVLCFSVCMGIAKIKDDNIVQAMQQYKADIVDTWNEYQAKSIKLHIDEQTLLMAALQTDTPNAVAAKQLADIQAEVTHYKQRLPAFQATAKDKQKAFDALSYRDDQFDLADALLSISLAIAGIAALTGTFWLLVTCWGFGLTGFSFVVAGFMGLPWHPDAIIAFLT